MTVTLQVAYPLTDGTTFDFDYYLSTHMPLVQEHLGNHITGATASRGMSGGPDQPSPFYAIATISFADGEALEKALAVAGPVMADIPNFTDCQPQVMIGEVVA